MGEPSSLFTAFTRSSARADARLPGPKAATPTKSPRSKVKAARKQKHRRK